MATNEEIYNALVLLYKECERLRDNDCEGREIAKMCGDCPFNGEFPESKIKKPRRFTDTDILWAKAAKASGAKEIKVFARAKFAMGEDGGSIAYLPITTFESIGKNEAVQIDDILKEEQ